MWNGASTLPQPELSQFGDQPDPLCIFLRVTSVCFISGKQNYVTKTDSMCFAVQAKYRSSTGHSPCKATIQNDLFSWGKAV